ncbi:OmpA family protein [Archangium sp.]|uniref:OmpA family protein n=1 Tax=Archangium sp. TaxID=1872627 RepID=UPI002D48916E|nr:OmpA family protein [Archangium sp.]HYO53072.1 OmpA family protein [Archangium sp.]
MERLELNPGAEGSLVVGTGEVMQAGQLRLSAVGHYSHKPLVLSRAGQNDIPIVAGRTTMHVAGAYSLTNWLQVGVQLPLVAQQVGDPAKTGLKSPGSWGLGTPTVGLRVGLLTQEERGGPLDLSVGADVGLPVGSSVGLGNEDKLRYMPRVMVGRRFGFIRAALDAGFMVRPQRRISDVGPSNDFQDEVGNELRIGAALATTGRRLRGEFNVRGMVPLSKQSGSAELLPGVRYLVNPSLEVFALAGVGLGAAPGTPLFRVLAGGSFGDVTPRRGPGESSVKCDMGLSLSPEECPNKDDDGDGVRNIDDKCPTLAGDPARAGCPRTDTDKDGIEDSLDGCPTEFGPAARQGCPVRDQDNDGVGDDDDACPSEPGPAENRGCPLKDRDKDGIENDQDECPDEPGPVERKGCPEEDSDKDGVPNRVDTCVHASGVESNLGCSEHEVPLVAITPSKLDLRGKVFFEASQARIQQRSFELLDWVAKVLREHPEIPRVVVGVHTDDRGFADQLRRLSQQRAEEVRRYLIGKGVAADRLEARGYGPDRPIDSNATSIGRENNRRVEFKIIRAGDASTDEPQR